MSLPRPMDLYGIHVPLVTPFTRAGGVDTESLERLARHCLEGGAAGLVALATTGEGALLNQVFTAMAEAARTGDAARGLELHNALLPMVNALFSEPAPAVLKAALPEVGLIGDPSVRAPLRPPAPEPVARTLAGLRAIP